MLYAYCVKLQICKACVSYFAKLRVTRALRFDQSERANGVSLVNRQSSKRSINDRHSSVQCESQISIIPKLIIYNVPCTNLIVSLHAAGARWGDPATLSRRLRRGSRQSVRRARFQGQAGELPASGRARGGEAVVRERCAVTVATAATHGGVRAVSRGAEPTWLLPVALPRAIRASLHANVACVRRRASAPPPRRRARHAAADHVRPINARRKLRSDSRASSAA